MKKHNIVSLAVGSAFAATLFAPVAQAADTPFTAKPLSAGYQLAQADKKGDASCGADKKGDKKADASCGADKKAADKKKDGKCGEAKCGADKKK